MASGIGMHSLRHSYATHLIEDRLGCSLRATSSRLRTRVDYVALHLDVIGLPHPHSAYPSSYVTDLLHWPSMDTVMQALADSSRRTLLAILRDHPATAGELADALPIARPGVSRHLRVLRGAGLVTVRQEAQRRIYSLSPAPLAELDAWLEDYRALWRNRLDALHTEIARTKTQANRSQP
jgi:DNA-binding transcriptional ArsR family regulator